MIPVFRLALILLIAITSAPEVFAENKQNPASPTTTQKPEDKPINITADHVAQDGKSDRVKAWGNVVIQFEDRILRADKVMIDNKTGIGEAKGHVILTQEDGTRIKSERSRFNMKTHKGVAHEVIGRVGPQHYIKGKEIKRFSKTHFELTESSITTCEGKLPAWLFQAKKMDLVLGDRALFTGAVFKVKNIPILYLPIGYLPINRERKSGFLMPKFGLSNTDGFNITPIYYWAINQWSDATVSVQYLEKRGVRPEIEYRYSPSKTTVGEFKGTYLQDKSTDGTFWKVDWTHDQRLPENTRLKGKLDLESSDSFNKTFADNTSLRTRRNSDSFASLTKSWSNSTLDFLTRYRDSTEDGRDDTLAQLPEITYQHQRQAIGNSSFFFNQDTSFTSYLIDLNTDPIVDDDFQVHRFDFHPQISRPIRIAPWMALTPTVGLRETIYSQGISPNSTNQRTRSFTRELFDVNAILEGPKINKIFNLGGERGKKLKHVIEPRLSYDFIPAIDEKDRDQIRRIDAVDSVDSTSKITYSLTQRLLEKVSLQDGSSQTREKLRFEVSQSYDFREATSANPPGTERKPFQEIRFDFDSHLFEALLFNIDSTFDVYDNAVKTVNWEIGIKPVSTVSLLVERRFTRNLSTFLYGSLYWAFKEGWQFQATTRFDELTETFRENDFSLLYDDPCMCWGFAFDFIKRDIITNGTRTDETKFLFTLTLRGIGTEKFGEKAIDHIHRRF